MDKAQVSRQSPAPFILTAELPSDIFAWADALRREHFPPERNVLGAHVTLFHAFAPSLKDELLRVVGTYASAFEAPEAVAEGLMNLGRGTALAIRSEGMLAIRERIAEHFRGSLTRQDEHKVRLHITIQNKVSPEAARALQTELADYAPRRFRFTGLGLHIYRGPHWEGLKVWRFRGEDHA